MSHAVDHALFLFSFHPLSHGIYLFLYMTFNLQLLMDNRLTTIIDININFCATHMTPQEFI